MTTEQQLEKQFDEAAKNLRRLLDYLEYADPNKEDCESQEAKDFVDALIEHEQAGELVFGDSFALTIIEARKEFGNCWWKYLKWIG